MINEKNNTIAITSKRPVPKIETTNLSEGLHQSFQMLTKQLKKNLKLLKKELKI